MTHQPTLPSILAESESYRLADAKTHGGHPVVSPHRSLIEAIRDEWQLRGALDATQFGVFSAYCTQRDFIEASEFFEDARVADILHLDHMIHPEVCPCHKSDLPEHYRAEWQTLCQKLGWPAFCDIEYSPESAPALVAHYGTYLRRLPPALQTATCLLNGMLGADLTTIVLVIEGLIPLSHLAEIAAQPYEPQDPEPAQYRDWVAVIGQFIDLSSGRLARRSAA